MHRGYMADLVIYETKTEDSIDDPNKDVDYDLIIEEPISDQLVLKTDLAQRLRLLEIAILHYKIFCVSREDEVALNEMAQGVRDVIKDLMGGE